MKKQLRRNSEKKRLDVMEEGAFDVHVSDLSASFEQPDKAVPPHKAHAPLPSQPTAFNASAKDKLSSHLQGRAATRPTQAKKEHLRVGKLLQLAGQGRMLKSPVPDPSENALQPRGEQVVMVSSADKDKFSPAAPSGMRTDRSSSALAKGRNAAFTRTDQRKRRAESKGPGAAAALSPSPEKSNSDASSRSRKLFGTLNVPQGRLVWKKARGIIVHNLNQKYRTTRDSYNSKVISDIIFNENTHMVTVFKDYLIYDDATEFMKRYYTARESATRLPKVFDFYDKYSKVFPNFVMIEEKKYMFKNIARKQRVIDEQQKQAEKLKADIDLNEDDSKANRLFSLTAAQEINGTKSEVKDTSESRQDTQLQSYIRAQPGEDRDCSGLADVSLRDLVDKFIQKDSRDSIDISCALRDFDVAIPSKPVVAAPAIKPKQVTLSMKPSPSQAFKPCAPAGDSGGGKVLRLRGKSNPPLAAKVKPTYLKPTIKTQPQAMNVIADIKALTIKIETCRRQTEGQKRTSCESVPAGRATMVNNYTSATTNPSHHTTESNVMTGERERNSKVDSTKSSSKSRNPRTQQNSREGWTSSKKSSVGIATAAVPPQSASQSRYHRASTQPRSAASTIAGNSITKPQAVPAASASVATRAEMRSYSQGSDTRRKSSAPAKSGVRPESRVSPSSKPVVSSPVRNVVKTKPSRNEKFGTSRGRVSADRPRTATQSPRKATPTGTGKNVPSRLGFERVRKVGGINIDIESLAKRTVKGQNVRHIEAGQKASSGKRFKSDYLNSLNARQAVQQPLSATGRKEERVGIPKQGSAGEAIGTILSYSKSTEALDRAKAMSTGTEPTMRRVESKARLVGEGKKSGRVESKHAYYKQFLK